MRSAVQNKDSWSDLLSGEWWINEWLQENGLYNGIDGATGFMSSYSADKMTDYYGGGLRVELSTGVVFDLNATALGWGAKMISEEIFPAEQDDSDSPTDTSVDSVDEFIPEEHKTNDSAQ